MVTSSDQQTLHALVTERMQQQGLSRKELIKKTGYENVPKGLRNLDHFLDTLEAPNNDFVISLLETLEIDGLTFNKAWAATKKELLEKADSIAMNDFKPYIELLGFPRATSWHGGLGRKVMTEKKIPADIHKLPFNEEISQVLSVYKEKFEEATSNAPSDLVDAIKQAGFRYHRQHDCFLKFDAEGRLEKVAR